MAKGGDGRMDRRMDGHLKIPPVSYRTSALWGRCPKKRNVLEFLIRLMINILVISWILVSLLPSGSKRCNGILYLSLAEKFLTKDHHCSFIFQINLDISFLIYMMQLMSFSFIDMLLT